MKRFLTAPIAKFNPLMAVCALSLTTLALPIAAIAQDALQSPDTPAPMTIAHSRQGIYVNNTQWLVEYADNGRNGDYHAVPWVFSADGTVRAGDLWHGVWKVKSKDSIHVSITMHDRHATMEHFTVKFTSPDQFTAYKNGHAYRYAVRQYAHH
ncbi:hypothetical protein [Pantanalinema sp. GBBB05]|uniref:hypothetical protein n=1 Tax=Pantanalinema sp. GBBB05 TaxID=2604139 RepID=UPI001D4A3C1A|nr:hypothetical protein [Pantanalinema sp. GBBB05]